MKITVFGASGQTGKQVVEQCLEAGHEVIAAMRNIPSTSTKKGLTYIQSDVLEDKSLSFLATEQADVVVIALGTKQLMKNNVRSLGTENIINALKANSNSTPTLILLSAAGIGDSKHQIGWGSRLIAYTLLAHTMREHETQEQAVINSGFHYHILRAVGLTNKSEIDYQLINEGKLPNLQVSRTAVATCIAELINTNKRKNTITCIC